MGFELESEMSGSVRCWLGSQGLSVKDEFVLPWGICDFVGLSFVAAQVHKRLAYGQRRPIGPLNRIQLLSQIPDQESGCSVTIAQLKKGAWGHDTQTIEDDLKRLMQCRFVVQNADGSFQKINGWAPLHHRIVAVELKLSRVSEVLAQAASHRAFSTESYIALPAKIATRVARSTRSSEIHATGVGILAVTRRTCEIALPSSSVGVDLMPVLQMHCAERFWRTRGSSS